MGALFLTVIVDSLLAAVVWLVLGSRFRWLEDPKANDVRNLLAYAAIGFPFIFVAVFYLIERL